MSLRNSYGWFVVLPDKPELNRVVQRLETLYLDTVTIRHSSGRPFIVGRWDSQNISVVRSGSKIIIVLGQHHLSDYQKETASKINGSKDLITWSAELAGSSHVIASFAAGTFVKGTATGLRRVYFTPLLGTAIASDSSAILAKVVEAAMDPARIAVRLLGPVAPWPVIWHSTWSGIDALFPGYYLMLPASGEAEPARYWSPPCAERPLLDAATDFRSALSDAVELRAKPHQKVVSHLSGLDSSAVCSLAARFGSDVTAITSGQPDPMDYDARWAARTATALRADGLDIDHHLIPADEVPLVYDGIADIDDLPVFDDPFMMLHNKRRFQQIVKYGQRYSSGVHLMGIGGDEICTAGSPWVHTKLRRAPIRGISSFRELRNSSHRLSYRSLIRSLLRHGRYSEWLMSAAKHIQRPGRPASPQTTSLGDWAMFPTAPAWITDDARELIYDQIIHAAESEVHTISTDRGVHDMVTAAYAGSVTMQGFQRLAADLGVEICAPFLDDRVMEAALSVDIVDQYAPNQYKPILVQAMRGIVPDATLQRSAKSETSATAVMGSRDHRDQIIAISEESRLVEMGLVDAKQLREACRRPISLHEPERRIETTISCEMWVRSQR